MEQIPSIPDAPASTTYTLPNPPKHKHTGGWYSALSTIAILIAAPIIALLLTTFVFQSYEVDGPSMETTLQHRDRLIVWKLQRTLSRITNNDYVPKRSAVIVFAKTGLLQENSSKEKQLIKRVIGLPGERVVIKNGQITIYNAQFLDGFNPDINHDFSQNISAITTGELDVVVPDDQIFVCGDNRVNSLDSRSFGSIPLSDVVGELKFRVFPVSNFKSFL